MPILIDTNATANNKPSVVGFKGKAFYFRGGVNLPFYTDGENSYTLMHETPTETPAVDVSQLGSMSATAGGFKYATTEINANTADGYNATTGRWNNPHETNLSAISTITGNFTNKKVTVTVDASAKNSDMTHKNIYGTEDGGDIFYWIGVVAVGTTTFEDDNIARTVTNVYGKVTTAVDGTQSYEELHYPCWNHRFVTASKKRIYTAGVKEYSTGTVTTNGTTTIIGDGTSWTRALEGDYFRLDGDSKVYIISDVVSTTEITLSTAYTGANTSGADYKIYGNKTLLAWSALHPLDSDPLWWAFPSDHYYEVEDSDNTPLSGLSIMGGRPITWKEKSYTLWTENGNDHIPTKSTTSIGTNANRAIAQTSYGTSIFISPEGQIYEAVGLIAEYTGIDLRKTRDGIEQSRIQYCDAIFYAQKGWYMLLYTSKDGTKHDRILVYDTRIREYVIFPIYGNCLGLVKSTEDGDTVTKPWFGTEGGFYYKMLTGNNCGGLSGTLEGTADSFGAATLDDSSASFNTTDDGLKDIYVYLFDTSGDFQEKQRISSNTGTQLTVDTNWTSSPQAGWTYEIGSLMSSWESKTFNFDVDNQKTINDFLIGYAKASSTTNVRVELFYSQTADMDDDTKTDYVTFDLSTESYYRPLKCKNNQFRYFKFRFWTHGTNNPATISSLSYNVERKTF